MHIHLTCISTAGPTVHESFGDTNIPSGISSPAAHPLRNFTGSPDGFCFMTRRLYAGLDDNNDQHSEIELMDHA